MLVVEANRFEGGIWLFWDDSRITLEVVTMMDQMISVLVKDQWEKPWLLSIVYASLKAILRKELWSYIRQLGDLVNIPWL